ncbi:DNA polymerase III subunit beta [Nitratifractor salsuginis]|uniref:Beta sliding clamp n=1 Tax=Nitratifractor salsuginis (strain DSM 16511 / JCM 12458 / E9I37-1) TaxID=749222 RepID=E6WXV5_NITSE|nr:DNA polymerase III subunit beta [Nitratifractor salsuginis]ADV45276.1 DNA polymerase III, beta subunit [Nitratifractor salsuginis DSM 16511]
MKIRAQKQVIESILINLQPFLEKKDASQITSHVYFETGPDRCIVRGTDNEIGLQIVTREFEVDHPGSFTANGKKLLDIIRILRDDEIILELLDNALMIKQQHSKFKLPIFDAEAFPSFPEIDGKPKISLDSMNLIRNLKKITPAIDTNNPKYELNGALINIKNDKTDLVGTDTRRLAVATIPNNSEEELALILPKKAILEIQKLFLDQIEIHYDETTLIITNDDYFFFTRLINGKFPDYERIIPRSLKYQIELPKKEMLEAIRLVTTIANDIKITFLSDAILFNALSDDNVEAKTEIELNTGIPDRFEISLNSRYLLDFLAQVDHDRFTIGMNDSTLPFMVRDENFITIIMPIIA